MKVKSIRSHLKPYGIVRSRRTTINHAFAAATAPYDRFDEALITERLSDLGLLERDKTLLCAYCLEKAETWDHVRATVKDSEFSGYGHVLSNLLPCCKVCNSRKGNRDWMTFFDERNSLGSAEARRAKIAAYLTETDINLERLRSMSSYKQLMSLKEQVLGLLGEADRLAAAVRKELADP